MTPFEQRQEQDKAEVRLLLKGCALSFFTFVVLICGTAIVMTYLLKH